MPLVGEPNLNPITGQVVRCYQLKPFVPSAGLKPSPPQWKDTIRPDDVKQRSASPCCSIANVTAKSMKTPCGLKNKASSGKDVTVKSSPMQTQWGW
jgi:hypothetical protein